MAGAEDFVGVGFHEVGGALVLAVLVTFALGTARAHRATCHTGTASGCRRTGRGPSGTRHGATHRLRTGGRPGTRPGTGTGRATARPYAEVMMPAAVEWADGDLFVSAQVLSEKPKGVVLRY